MSIITFDLFGSDFYYVVRDLWGAEMYYDESFQRKFDGKIG